MYFISYQIPIFSLTSIQSKGSTNLPTFCLYEFAHSEHFLNKWNCTICYMCPSLSMFSRFNHIILHISTTEEYCSIVWIYHSLLIHSLVDSYLGTFCFGATRNNSAMNNNAQVFEYLF